MATREIELSIEGMSCAACAVRIEKKLNKISDVSAAVNYATATARVTAPSAMPVQTLITVIDDAGYSARDSTAPGGGERRSGGRPGCCVPAPQADRRPGLLRSADRPVAAAVGRPGRPFSPGDSGFWSPTRWWWRCGAAWPFHRAALINARHGAAEKVREASDAIARLVHS